MSADEQSLELERWGIGDWSNSGGVIQRLADGYWTPWHLADDALRRLRIEIQKVAAMLSDSTEVLK